MIYTIEKTLKEHADKVPADEKKQVEEAVIEAKKHLDSQDAAVLEKATAALTQASNKMAEQMYKTAGAQPGGPGAPGAGGPENGAHPGAEGAAGAGQEKKGDDVIDADFKEV